MIVGYARVSTVEQIAGWEVQHKELAAAGAERLFAEQVSSVSHRPQLEAALDWVREGDVLCVTRLDRLARSVASLVHIVERLEAKKASLRILNIALDTSSSTGRLMLSLLAAIAQFEREIMRERQIEGIRRAQALGKFKGRVPVARRKAKDVSALAALGVAKQDIAARLGISRASVYRILSEQTSALPPSSPVTV